MTKFSGRHILIVWPDTNLQHLVGELPGSGAGFQRAGPAAGEGQGNPATYWKVKKGTKKGASWQLIFSLEIHFVNINPPPS